ncbi:MAG: hypothetical protein WEB13_00820 [Dehalococcoidia bacterium]
MSVDKLSISFDAELGNDVRNAARQSGRGLSAWLADAARAKLRADSFAAFLADWEREHGALTPEELSRAEAELGLRSEAPSP